MLTDQDIEKLTLVLASKSDVKDLRIELKQDISEVKSDILSIKGDVLFIKNDIIEVKSYMADLKELVQGLIISSDNLAKSFGELRLEYAAISTQLSRHENWIKQIAEKVGIKLATD